MEKKRSMKKQGDMKRLCSVACIVGKQVDMSESMCVWVWMGNVGESVGCGLIKKKERQPCRCATQICSIENNNNIGSRCYGTESERE